MVCAAAAMLAVAKVARTRFYTPPGMLAAILRQCGSVLATRGNLNNELGLTEGNSRLTTGGSGPINARPLFGRTWEASVMYRF